jgi:AAA family ATP:ADP antiporter
MFFLVGYIAFALLLAPPVPAPGVVWSFYLFGDLVSTLMVATFFAFLNDSLDPQAAKRQLGLIGLGGVAGGFFGSSVLRTFIDALSIPAWLGVTGVCGVAILFLARSAGRRVSRPHDRRVVGDSEGSSALAGARLVFRSSYLVAIAVMIAVYEIASTVVDFQFTSAVQHELSGGAIGRHIGAVYAVTNGVSFFVQLFLTSFVLTRYGPGVALIVLPLFLAVASGGFVIAPTLALGSLLSVADNGLSYSLNQSSKELLYVPTTSDEKYRAKAFIDMFVQRFAKVIAIGVSLVVTTSFSDYRDIRWLAGLLLPLLVIWIVAARHAGKGFATRERGRRSDHVERARMRDEPGTVRV